MAETEINPLLKDWVSEHLGKDFKKATHLTVKESKNDPPEEPYKSLYAARELFLCVQAKLDSSCPKHLMDHEDFKVLCACTLLELGLNYINTDELSEGERNLEACLHRLEGVVSKVKTASISIQAHNQLGVLWGNRSEHQKALEFLLKAKAVYDSHIALPPPLTDSQWITGEDGEEWTREKQFESGHTLTLFYLAQVYANLKQPKFSAQYCQTTLSRQLETREYDPVEWSLNCATLSQYYMTSGNWPQSRHCLAAATSVLSRYKAEECGSSVSDSTGEEEPIEDSRMAERVAQTEADISRCWTKYCLALLTTSYEKREGNGGSMESGSMERGSCSQQQSPAQGSKQFKFEPLEVSDIESSVLCDLVEDYDGAKMVFVTCQRHIENSKRHYSLENFASEHVIVVQDHSNAFKLIAHFESSPEMKCRMHKRRIDMLTHLLEELNPRIYLGEHRQIMYEVAETQSEMADLKIVSGSESPTPHTVEKINKLLRSGISMFQQFVASFYERNASELPDNVDQDYLRPVLLSKLNMARLYSKIITPDPASQVRPATVQ